MIFNIFKINKVVVLLTSMFAFNNLDIDTILQDKWNNLYSLDNLERIVENKNLLIIPEDRSKEILEIRERELIFLKKLGKKYELAFDNISPKYESSLKNFNKKKIFPLEFLKESNMNPANYELFNYCYMNNIKINSFGVNDFDLNFIKSNGITKEIKSKYGNINFDNLKYKGSNKFSGFYFIEDNIFNKLNEFNVLKKKVVLFVDINHFAGYKDKNNFFNEIDKYKYMIFIPSDESFGDYKIIRLDKINFI